MAAPLPPDMENKGERRARGRSSLSYGVMGFALGTAFGVGLGIWLDRSINGLTVFLIAAFGIAIYWLLARVVKKR